jgi:PAS domain S-box-containing protein
LGIGDCVIVPAVVSVTGQRGFNAAVRAPFCEGRKLAGAIHATVEPIHQHDVDKPLNVLLVEHSPDDAAVILGELERGGYRVTSERIQTAESMQEALGRSAWDVVISDFSLPGFGGPEALAVLREMGQDLPFIIVSGMAGEEAALKALKAGAHDFMPKTKLARLVPAIERELRDVQTKRERTLVYDALRQSEAQHRSLVDRCVFGILQSTTDGRLITVNPALAKMLGYASSELPAAGLGSVFVDAAAFEALMRKVIERGRVSGEEVMWQPSAGDPIRVRLFLSIVDGSTRLSPIVQIIVEDVTERHRLQEQLRQAQKMEAIGHLAGGIAHDFNNLLTAILGYSELLTEQIGPDLPMGRDLREIVKAAQRASALTRQLLAFSRRQVLVLAPIDLNRVITNLETMLRRLVGNGITLKTVLAPGLRPVMADAIHMEQVLINLAVNARDAMPRGGTLTIETHNADLDARFAADHAGARAGAFAMLSVGDTGMGMSREIQERIFEPFFTTKDRGRGTGLGLAAVHGIVIQLKGWIDIDSEPGRGTAFHVYLPETDHAVQAETVSGPEMSAAGSETIVVVEDEDAVRAFVKTVLERFGYRVLDAPDAESALTLVGTVTGRIDLLLTDVILPKMDGLELARRVMKDRPSLPVLFMSGYPEQMANTGGGFLEPGVELLEKPFTAQSILARVRLMLGRGAGASLIH